MLTDPNLRNRSRLIEPPVLLKRLVSLRGPLTRQRVIFVMGRMLFLAAEEPNEPMLLEVNSPGGTKEHVMDILRIMDRVGCGVATFCRREARGTALVIAAHGLRGFRAALPECRFSLSSSSISGDAKPLPDALLKILLKDVGSHSPPLLRSHKEPAEFDSLTALRNGLIDTISPTPLYPGNAANLKPEATAKA